MSTDSLAAEKWVKGILRAEMAKKGVTYADLAKLLRFRGVEEDESNLANKIGRGRFSAILFLQCLSVLGVTTLSFEPFWKFGVITDEVFMSMDEFMKKTDKDLD